VKKAIEVLVLDDEPIVCERLESYLAKKGMEVETFQDSTLALKRLEEKQFDVVVTDLKMDGPTGMDVLRTIREREYPTEVIIITGYATIEKTREADYIGVFEFIAKPFQLSVMQKLVEKAAKKARRGK
jgi:DNA-binding NtrC family response regulator